MLLVLAAVGEVYAELRVPAFTAYLDPNPNGASVSEKEGITGWRDPTLSVSWFGEIKSPGKLQCAVAMRLPAGARSGLRMTVGRQSRDVQVQGAGEQEIVANFGSYQVKQAGYQRFTLQALNPAGQPQGDLTALILGGSAAEEAHFNLKPRRNAASVHLAYPQPKDMKVAGFYCELTGLEDPVATYYMACGWHRGYLGMQVNSPTERRIIFSVWDSGGEAVDRKKVGAEDRVALVAKGAEVDSGDFGNEGTGGHSHLVFPWKTGKTQRFFVTAQPTDSTRTTYAGYWFHPDLRRWTLISAWSAPHEGGWLRGLYSFSENFGGSNGQLRRKALYGNQWIQDDAGQWFEVTSASFSHDETGKADRLDRFMGLENGQFFLSQGGFVPGFTKFGETFTRPPRGKPPVIKLPPLAGK
jgi:hypothetical protein